MIYLRNWRDMQPQIAHLSAVMWSGLAAQERSDEEDGRNCLQRIRAFARHALQGRKTSDHHKHEQVEQVYYVLSGRGEVLFDEERFPVEAGDAIYLPSGFFHQMFNEDEPWLEHHVISAKVEGDGGSFAIRNWRQVPPAGDGAGAMRWRQLGREGEEGVGFLRGMAFIDREAVQPRSRTIERCCQDLEQVYYVLENRGMLLAGGEEQEITEGDLIHLPPGTTYAIQNPHEEWLSYMIVGM